MCQTPVAGKAGFDFPINESGVASSSRGLVGDTAFAVIPNVQPFHTFAITLSVLMVSPGFVVSTSRNLSNVVGPSRYL